MCIRDRYYVAAENCLMDKATGKKYTMEREEIAELAGIRLYPGQDAPYACLLYTSRCV